VEEGGVCKGSLDHLRELYADGVRMMTLTWNYRNELGCPNDIPDGCGQVYARYFEFVPRTDNGLTEKGFAFAEAMQSMGMLVDVSHLSDAGFYDIARTVRGPFVASHSNCRALCGCNRDMTDDMIRTVGEHGGVIGLNYCPEFLTAAASRAQCLCSPERLAAHARHMMDVGGREIVGLGSDFDGIGRDGLELNDCSEVGKIEAELEKEHFTQTEIDGIMGQNVMRVYREVLK
jgi:membrane dipeptidase